MDRLKLLAIVCACMLVVFTACNSHDRSTAHEAESSVLSKPPFDQLTDSISRFPNDPALYLRRAALLSQANLHPIATADFKKAWELSGDENIALEYASNLLLNSRIRDAEKLLKDCAAKFPDNTDFERRLGEVYLQNGQADKALQQYNSILAKDSFNFEVLYDKGSVLLQQHDTAGAMHALERSFRIMPINYSGMALANIYVARKDPRALQICNFLLARDTGRLQTEPMFMKGLYYSDTRQYDKAISAFDTCIQRDWKMTDAYIEKGIILYQRNDLPGALKVFGLAATVSNTDPDVYYWIGRCYEKNGDKQQAILNYERALSLDNNLTEARDALKRMNG